MRWIRGLWIPLLLCSMPAASGAEEIVLGLRGSFDWDTRAFQQDNLEKNAFKFRGGPRVIVSGDHSRVGYELNYRPMYQHIFNSSARDTWDHFLLGDGEWRIDPATTMQIFDRFSRTERPLFQSANTTGTGTTDVQDEVKATRNLFRLDLQRLFDERLSMNLRGAYLLQKFDAENRFDSDSIQGQGFVRYGLTQVDDLDLGFTVDYQSIEGNSNTPGSRNTSYQALGGWRHRFTPTFRFEAQGGPSVVDSRGVAGNDDTQVSGFAEGLLRQDWKRLTARLIYRRTLTPVAGAGVATAVDSVTSVFNYDPDPAWELELRGNITLRRSLNDQVVILGGQRVRLRNPVDVFQWSVIGSVRHRLQEHLYVTFDMRYLSQEQHGTSPAIESLDRFIAVIRFEYSLEPYRL